MSALAIRAARVGLAHGLIRARDDLAAFIELCGKDDHGNYLRLAPMHLAWIAHINYCWSRGLKAIVLSHFGSGKSSTLAVPLAAWLVGRDRNTRVKFVTNDDPNAMRRAAGVEAMMFSREYEKVFGKIERGEKWTDHEMRVKRDGAALDPTIHARGVITTGVGGRADVLVFDDIVDQRNSMDETQRAKVLEFAELTWLSRLEPDGKVLYIATLWHLDDATHHLMQRPGWCTLKQSVSEDCSCVEQEVLGADENYPGVSLEMGNVVNG